MAEKVKKVKLIRHCHIEGERKKAGDVIELPEGDANYLIAINKATEDLTVKVAKDDKAGDKK